MLHLDYMCRRLYCCFWLAHGLKFKYISWRGAWSLSVNSTHIILSPWHICKRCISPVFSRLAGSHVYGLLMQSMAVTVMATSLA